jgi:RNA polymerase sigma-70 factor (ECF subfamily)
MIIYAHLHELNEPYKEVFMLRLFGELEYSQIAKLFGKTESWVRVTYHRAKMKLMKSVKEDEAK